MFFNSIISECSINNLTVLQVCKYLKLTQNRKFVDFKVDYVILTILKSCCLCLVASVRAISLKLEFEPMTFCSMVRHAAY